MDVLGRGHLATLPACVRSGGGGRAKQAGSGKEAGAALLLPPHPQEGRPALPRQTQGQTPPARTMGKLNAQGTIQFEWCQEIHKVVVILHVGPSLSIKAVSHECTPHVLSVKLPDGRHWSARLFQEVDCNQVKLGYKGGKLAFTLLKKEPNVMWDSLEAPPPPPPMPNGVATLADAHLEEDTPVFNVNHIKHDCIEGHDIFTVHVYVKSIRKDTLDVKMQEEMVTITFSTSDSKFHALYHGREENTIFQWAVKLKGPIIPEQSRYKANASILELHLKKKDSLRWGGFEMLPDAIVGGSGEVTSNKWIAVPWKTENGTGNARNGEEATAKSGGLIPHMNKGMLMGKPVCPGMTGLDNIGNTCFMNAVIQCLANTRELRDYFLGSHYQQDINVDNPLGMQGQLAVSFAVLLKVMWSGGHKSFAPSKLKSLVSVKASQFSGFLQHDAHEFMAFLLDGLHEDLNRVRHKEYTEAVESDGRPDDEVAQEAWRTYKKRNDSIIVDLFQGQYKSKLVCPECGKVSITFDPFLYLSVPLPKKQKTIPVMFFWRDPLCRPLRCLVRVTVDAQAEQLRQQLAQRTGVHPKCIRMLEVYRSQVRRFFRKETPLATVSHSDLVLAFETLDEAMAGEPVVNFVVTQRLMVPSPPVKCSQCRKEPAHGEPKLKRCTKCFRVAYCNQICQKSHWNHHRPSCHRVPEPVGCPFLLSLPASHVTYARLALHLEAQSRHSVHTFQPLIPHSRLNSSGTLNSSSSSSSSSASSPTSSSSENGPCSPPPLTTTPTITPLSSPTTSSDTTLEENLPLFDIHLVTHDGEELMKEPSGGGVLHLGQAAELTMDWHNCERMRGCCMVESKPIDYDPEPRLGGAAADDPEGGEDGRPSILTLQQCIRLFTEPEVLSQAEAWYCSCCRELREATKQMSLWKLPTILVIQLKRFNFKNLTMRDKIDRMVHFPLRDLNMSAYMLRTSIDEKDTIYDLYAVVNHHGGILGGHYTAFTRCVDKNNTMRSEECWRLCDDTIVEPVEELEVTTKSAYVLFYRRREVDAEAPANLAVPEHVHCESDLSETVTGATESAGTTVTGNVETDEADFEGGEADEEEGEAGLEAGEVEVQTGKASQDMGGADVEMDGSVEEEVEKALMDEGLGYTDPEEID